MFLTLTVEMLL